VELPNTQKAFKASATWMQSWSSC